MLFTTKLYKAILPIGVLFLGMYACMYYNMDIMCTVQRYVNINLNISNLNGLGGTLYIVHGQFGVGKF